MHIRKSKQLLFYGLEMKNAFGTESQMPELFDGRETDPVKLQLQEMIKDMTKYHDSERLSLPAVKYQSMGLYCKKYYLTD